MKATRGIIKKLFFAVGVVMLCAVGQAYAGSVTLTGQIDYITTGDATGVSFGDIVTLDLNWLNDAIVSPVGESNLTLNSSFGNTMTFSIVDSATQTTKFSLINNPIPGSGDYPTAHFTDGVIDGFELNWFDVTPSSALGGGWSVYFTTALITLDQTGDIFFEVYDDSASGDWFEGSLNLPAASPAPIPGAVWLFGSSLLGLVGIRRKMK